MNSTEARVSWNAKYTLAGFEQQITLRGEDEEEVLERAKKIVSRLSQLSAPTRQRASQAPSQGTAETPHCPRCGAEAVYITWQAKGNRAAGGAWKCKPCNAWVDKQAQAA